MGVLMTPDTSQYISAHSAAAALVRHRVKQHLMTPEDAVAFTDTIDFLVKTGQLPDDAKLLALAEAEWNIATSEGHTTAGIIDLVLP